jgi:hypothetical protein
MDFLISSSTVATIPSLPATSFAASRIPLIPRSAHDEDAPDEDCSDHTPNTTLSIMQHLPSTHVMSSGLWMQQQQHEPQHESANDPEYQNHNKSKAAKS